MALPAWVPADETKPAPGALLLVQSFVNTRDADLRTDLLTESAQANEWLRESGLLGPDVSAGPQDLRMAREVREAIRAGRHLGPVEGVRQRRMPVGVLRPVARP